MVSALQMVIEPTTSGTVSIVPTIDEVPLVDLVGGYEAAHGYSPAGGYAGIVPDHFRFGDLVSYFTGDDNGEWPRTGVIWLLGCDCGEVGCWPLEARVRAHEGRVDGATSVSRTARRGTTPTSAPSRSRHPST